jgi:hypothetical protein
MKVKNFLTLPSGTLIRKATIQSLEPDFHSRKITITCENGEGHLEAIRQGDSFQAALTDLHCQLNEE